MTNWDYKDINTNDPSAWNVSLAASTEKSPAILYIYCILKGSHKICNLTKWERQASEADNATRKIC